MYNGTKQMNVKRIKKEPNLNDNEFVFKYEHCWIVTNRNIPQDEQEMLGMLLFWSHVEKGIINDKRWYDYIHNINSPVWLDGKEKGDGLGELVFTAKDTWNLDYWEDIFDEYS